MFFKITSGCLAMVLLLLLAATASASHIDNDTAAMMTGHVTYQSADLTTINAEVDYAVYAPGTFSTSAMLGNPADPSAGQDFIYAYEIRNSGTASVTKLSVGLDYLNDPNAFVNGNSMGDLSTTALAGLAPRSA